MGLIWSRSPEELKQVKDINENADAKGVSIELTEALVLIEKCDIVALKHGPQGVGAIVSTMVVYCQL